MVECQNCGDLVFYGSDVEITREDRRNFICYGCAGFEVTLWEKIRHFFLSLWCKRVGHQIVDDGSYANGESGADYHCCTRCGESWSHTHY